MFPKDGNYNNIPYESNVQIKFYENRENENYPLHWHTATEIIMPLQQTYEVVLLKKAYTLRENDIFIVPSCELHGLIVPPTAEKGKRIILQFEPTLLYALSGLSGAMSALHNLNLITPEKTPEIHETAQTLILAMYKEYLQQDALRSAAIYAKIIELYIAFIRYYNTGKELPDDGKPSKRQEYIARLNAVFEYIDMHISEKLTLEQVAEVACFSKFHFSRIFKEFTNLSFYQYLNRKRVEKAETLLLNPELPITDVAFDAGFESISTFNRVFKEIKKYTPSEYKKLYI